MNRLPGLLRPAERGGGNLRVEDGQAVSTLGQLRDGIGGRRNGGIPLPYLTGKVGQLARAGTGGVAIGNDGVGQAVGLLGALVVGQSQGASGGGRQRERIN
ncbi:hypothetical protein D9M70_550110 [compost metagenome]